MSYKQRTPPSTNVPQRAGGRGGGRTVARAAAAAGRFEDPNVTHRAPTTRAPLQYALLVVSETPTRPGALAGRCMQHSTPRAREFAVAGPKRSRALLAQSARTTISAAAASVREWNAPKRTAAANASSAPQNERWGEAVKGGARRMLLGKGGTSMRDTIIKSLLILPQKLLILPQVLILIG